MAPATETRTIRAYIHDTQGIFAAPAGITVVSAMPKFALRFTDKPPILRTLLPYKYPDICRTGGDPVRYSRVLSRANS